MPHSRSFNVLPSSVTDANRAGTVLQTKQQAASEAQTIQEREEPPPFITNTFLFDDLAVKLASKRQKCGAALGQTTWTGAVLLSRAIAAEAQQIEGEKGECSWSVVGKKCLELGCGNGSAVVVIIYDMYIIHTHTQTHTHTPYSLSSDEAHACSHIATPPQADECAHLCLVHKLLRLKREALLL